MELVIFDCDGVLVDSESICASILVRQLASLGVSTNTKVVEELFFASSHFPSFLESLEEEFNTRLPGNFENNFRNKYDIESESQLRPIKDVESLLKNLTHPKCVASSGPLRKINKSLAVTGLDEFFSNQHIFSSHEIQSFKPDPGIFLYAATQMGFGHENCIVIEDSPEGVQAGLSAGMEVIGYGDKLKNIKEIPVFRSMSEVSHYLNFIT